MSGSSELTGRVVDGSGAPVPDAWVVIVRSTVPMPEIALLADNEGRFCLRLPQGVFTLRAHGATAVGEVEIASGTGDSEVVIVAGEL